MESSLDKSRLATHHLVICLTYLLVTPVTNLKRCADTPETDQWQLSIQTGNQSEVLYQCLRVSRESDKTHRGEQTSSTLWQFSNLRTSCSCLTVVKSNSRASSVTMKQQYWLQRWALLGTDQQHHLLLLSLIIGIVVCRTDGSKLWFQYSFVSETQ